MRSVVYTTRIKDTAGNLVTFVALDNDYLRPEIVNNTCVSGLPVKELLNIKALDSR